jgi:hypothetical protein
MLCVDRRRIIRVLAAAKVIVFVASASFWEQATPAATVLATMLVTIAVMIRPFIVKVCCWTRLCSSGSYEYHTVGGSAPGCYGDANVAALKRGPFATSRRRLETSFFIGKGDMEV